ncbi:MAG: ABC transporter ATP-binding protein [Rhodospirillaceae bacterium]|nr:ABC transporter ATP-binding protein [Rhodospirillaceae bacterium]
MTVVQTGTPLLTAEGVSKWFFLGNTLFRRGRQDVVRAVDGVSFDIRRGEVLGLVGESGSGKSTVGRTILRLNEPTAGSIRFDGHELAGLTRRQLRPLRPRMQLIFQDPFSSLNPRMTVGRIIDTPITIHAPETSRAARRERVAELLHLVGLSPRYAERYPHEFSGGQRQRIGIARALVMNPDFLVADEPVSALDVSIQAQVVNLLLEIREKLGLTMLFISHDLAVVGCVSDRIAVMYLGRIVELAPTRSLFLDPRHPYTEALFSAEPIPNPAIRRDRILLKGEIPSPVNPPSGCVFRTRCPYALPDCAKVVPPLTEVAPGHAKACIRDDLDLRPSQHA